MELPRHPQFLGAINQVLKELTDRYINPSDVVGLDIVVDEYDPTSSYIGYDLLNGDHDIITMSPGIDNTLRYLFIYQVEFINGQGWKISSYPGGVLEEFNGTYLGKLYLGSPRPTEEW